MTAARLAAAAFVVRAAMLPSRFPYIDDLLQLHAVTRPTLAGAARDMAGIGPLQPPLDYALGWTAARFTSDLATLRLLPALWGALAVYAACRLGERLIGRAFGLWWAALLAGSMPLVSYSVTLRTYSLAVLLGLLAWSAFEDALGSRTMRRYAVWQALFQISYPHAWLLGLVQLATAYTRRGQAAFAATARALLPSWAVLGAWLAWWHLAVPTSGGFHYEVPWSALAVIAKAFNQARGPGLLLLPAFALLAIASARKPGPRRELVAAASLAFAAPLAAIFAIHRAESVLLLPRHVLPLLPAWLALVAAGFAAAQERAKAKPAAAAGLALLLAWTAADPLVALARRERELSSYLSALAFDLKTRANPSDVVVFADPNTGATVLHEADPEAFDALAGIEMRQGIALFRFPPALRFKAASNARIAVYTLSPLDPALATIDAAGLRDLRRFPERKTWLVDAEGLNAVPNAGPFASLNVAAADLQAAGPGMAVLR